MNNNIFGLDTGLGIDCSQTTLSINDGQNNLFVNCGTIVTFKVCGQSGADFIIQDIGQDTSLENISDFYPYNILDRGQLDIEGNYIFSTPLNKVGTYIFRAGIWCTVADLDYCYQVSNAITVTVLDVGCTANYQCRQPLDGYEYDANYCGWLDRINSSCNPPIIPPVGNGNVGNRISNSNLLKIGVVIVGLGAIAYYTSRNGFNVRLRKDK